MSTIYTNVAQFLGYIGQIYSALPATLKSVILYCFGAVLIVSLLLMLSKEGD